MYATRVVARLHQNVCASVDFARMFAGPSLFDALQGSPIKNRQPQKHLLNVPECEYIEEMHRPIFSMANLFGAGHKGRLFSRSRAHQARLSLLTTAYASRPQTLLKCSSCHEIRVCSEDRARTLTPRNSNRECLPNKLNNKISLDFHDMAHKKRFDVVLISFFPPHQPPPPPPIFPVCLLSAC